MVNRNVIVQTVGSKESVARADLINLCRARESLASVQACERISRETILQLVSGLFPNRLDRASDQIWVPADIVVDVLFLASLVRSLWNSLPFASRPHFLAHLP